MIASPTLLVVGLVLLADRGLADEFGLVAQSQGRGYLGRVKSRLDASVEATTAGHFRGTYHTRQ